MAGMAMHLSLGFSVLQSVHTKTTYCTRMHVNHHFLIFK